MLEYFAEVVLTNEPQHHSLIRMYTSIQTSRLKNLKHTVLIPSFKRWQWGENSSKFMLLNISRNSATNQGRCAAQSHIAWPHQPSPLSEAAPRDCACATVCEQSTGESETFQLQISKTRNSASPGSLFFISSLQFWPTSFSSEELEDKQVKIHILIFYIYTHTRSNSSSVQKTNKQKICGTISLERFFF